MGQPVLPRILPLSCLNFRAHHFSFSLPLHSLLTSSVTSFITSLARVNMEKTKLCEIGTSVLLLLHSKYILFLEKELRY